MSFAQTNYQPVDQQPKPTPSTSSANPNNISQVSFCPPPHPQTQAETTGLTPPSPSTSSTIPGRNHRTYSTLTLHLIHNPREKPQDLLHPHPPPHPQTQGETTGLTPPSPSTSSTIPGRNHRTYSTLTLHLIHKPRQKPQNLLHPHPPPHPQSQGETTELAPPSTHPQTLAETTGLTPPSPSTSSKTPGRNHRTYPTLTLHLIQNPREKPQDLPHPPPPPHPQSQNLREWEPLPPQAPAAGWQLWGQRWPQSPLSRCQGPRAGCAPGPAPQWSPGYGWSHGPSWRRLGTSLCWWPAPRGCAECPAPRSQSPVGTQAVLACKTKSIKTVEYQWLH